MKKHIYLITTGLLVLAASGARAQMKVGSPGAPDPSAMLEVTGGPSNNKGLLVPRISLTNITTWGLAGATPTAGMVVYNTNASITGGSGVGLYFWNGTQWVKAAASADWTLNGNAGTNPATNFIGTTDNQPLVLRTNNLERVRVDTGGRVGIGTASPKSRLGFNPLAVEPKITLYSAYPNTHYGFGISDSQLNYHVELASNSHVFFQGGMNGDGNELMRIQGNGNVGIGTSSPTARLDIRSNQFDPYGGIRLMDNSGVNAVDVNITPGYDMNISTDSSTTLDMAGMAGYWVFGDHVIPGVSPTLDLGRSDRRWRNTWGLNLDMNGTARIAGSAGTPASIMGRDATGNVGAVTLGAGLTLVGGVLSAPASVAGWGLAGNAGTNPATNFIGTTDNQPLVLRTNNAEAMRVAANGNVGIGTNDPNTSLSITPSQDGAKITLWDGGNDTAHYGFGITGTFLNYHVVNATAAHRFFAGGKNGNGNELMRIQGNGNVGIGTAIPHNRLDLGNTNGLLAADSAGKKLAVYNNPAGTDFYGLGVSTGLLQLHASSQPNEAPAAVINSVGNVGIGTDAPTAKLDIRSRQFTPYGGIRLMDDSGANALDANITPGYDMNISTDSSTTLDMAGMAGYWVFGDHVIPGVSPTLDLGRSDRRWRNTWGLNLDMNGTARIAGSAGTPASIMGRDATGNVGSVTLGSGLTLAGGVLSAPAAAAGWGVIGNTGTNPATNFIGTTDNQPLVLRTNNAEAMRVAADGSVGIGTGLPHSRLDLGATNGALPTDSIGKKLAVYNTAAGNDFYGLGVSTGLLQLHAASQPNEAPGMVMNSVGNVGIGTTAPNSSLSITPSQDGAKITLWDGGIDTAHYGFGITGTFLNYHVVNATAVHRFLAGGKNGNGNELMRIQGNGNVGIGTSSPTARLDIRSNQFDPYGGIRLMDNGGTNVVDANITPGYDMNIATDSSTTLDMAGMAGYWVFGDHIIPGVSPTLDLGRSDRRWRNTWGLNLDMNGTARIAGSAGTPTTITGRDASGNIGNVTLGTGLSLAGGVLSAASAGWGLTGNTGTNPAVNYIGTSDAQPLVLRTNAAEHMRITATGNIGVNNATPLSPLSFASVLEPKISLWDGGSATDFLGFGVSGGQLNYHVTTSSSHVFYGGGKNADGTELMRVRASDGFVGIGTASPAQKLDVNGTARISGSAGTATGIVGRNAAGDISNITLGTGLSLAGGVLNASASTAGWGLNGNAGTNPVVDYVGTSDAQPLVLRTNAAEHLRITAAGNIGINNGAPLVPLSFASVVEPKISFWDNGSATDHIGIGVSPGALNYHVTPGSVHSFYSGGKNGDGTELMRIRGTDGFVGIGTSNPDARLTVVSDGLGVGSTDDIKLASYGASVLPTFFFQAATGTEAAPGNTATNTQMGSVQFSARTGGAFGAEAGIASTYTGNGTTTHGGTLTFHTRAPGAGNFAPRMTIDETGNIGIGTLAPAFDFHMSKANYGPFGGFAISDDGGANASTFTITPGYYGSVSAFGVTLDVTGEAPIGFSDPVVPAADGAFSCGTSAYRWSAVYAQNGTINTSDAREKKNVRNLGLGLDVVMKLRPVMYDWKDNSSKDKIGFIAQELREVVPNVVVGDESKERLGVFYADMVPVLTKAIQEQQAQIEELKAENEKARSENAMLSAEVKEMKDKEATYAELAARVKQMEQMLGMKENTNGRNTARK